MGGNVTVPYKLEVIRHLVEREVPVCAHLGLTPQSVLRLGGYRVQGRGEDAAATGDLDTHATRPCPSGSRQRRRVDPWTP